VAVDVVQAGKGVDGARVCRLVGPDFTDQHTGVGVPFPGRPCGRELRGSDEQRADGGNAIGLDIRGVSRVVSRFGTRGAELRDSKP
jgi:hypothetical protein